MEYKECGLIHLYCGEGKGKTTAAVGLAVRAAGRGRNVVFSQFMKGNDSGEINILRELKKVTVMRCEKEFPFYQNMTETDKQEMTQMHNENLRKITELIQSDRCDVLILDEVTYAYAWNLLDKTLLETLIADKPESLEIVLTGQNPAAFFTEHADYISNIQALRHPYEKGIGAREGIEY